MTSNTCGESEYQPDSRNNDARPLLRSFPNPSNYGALHHAKQDNISTTTRLARHLTAEINTRHADIILIVCFFVSGLIDAGAYNAFYVFTSLQTGNTIFAALSVSNLPDSQPQLAWTKSLCAVLSYLLGSWAMSNFHRRFGERKRWVLATSFTIQATLTLVSASLIRLQGASDSNPADPPGSWLLTMLPKDPGFPWTDLVPIGLLSFSASAKQIASMMLKFPELPVVVLTTLFGQLMADPDLLKGGLKNVNRNRKLAGVALYFLGAVCGGVAAAHERLSFSGGLFIAAAMHLVVACGWLRWRAGIGKENDVQVDSG